MSKSENIKTFFRFFPMKKMEWKYIRVEENTIYMRHLQELSKSFGQNQKPTFWEFKSDGVFLNSDQKDVYASIMDGVPERIAEGNNGIILAFGQTRTGKTITIGGLQLSEEDFGITPRVIFDLFRIKSELPKNVKMCIQMSYTEFTNTTAADLLKPYPYSVDIYHSRKATKIKVRSEFDALKLLYKGEGRKTFSSSSEYLSNLCSTVVTFHITTSDIDFSNPNKNCSRLHIIDMAGVDTIGSPSSIYKQAPDIGKANIIKTNLEQFVLVLKKNIPLYSRLNERTNPLIYFLGSDLSNESIIRFIGHIRTPKQDLFVTISMLRFGQFVKGLKPKHKEIVAEINEEIQVQHLQTHLEELEREKIHNSIIMNQDLTQNINNDRLEHIQRLIQEYLKDHINEITVLNVAEASEVFRIFKQMCNECEAEKCKITTEMQLELSKYRRDSKTSSKTSLKMSKSASKKSSKRSKESILNSNEKIRSSDKMGSRQVLPEKKVASKTASKKSSINNSLVNRRGSGALSAKKSSVSKRRSNTSASMTERRESKMSHIVLLPDIIPDFPDAWEMFLKEKDEFYTRLYEEYVANETELREIYTVYSTEINKLQCFKEIFAKRKQEIYEAQMLRKFNVLENVDSSEELLVMGSAEKLSQENYNTAQENLIQQQEIVLKWQSEIKICLNNRVDLKKQLNEEFDAFCKEKFSASIPDISEEDMFQHVTTELDIETVTKELEEDKTCAKKGEMVIRLEELKKIMAKELLKNMKITMKKKNIWKNYSFKSQSCNS